MTAGQLGNAPRRTITLAMALVLGVLVGCGTRDPEMSIPVAGIPRPANDIADPPALTPAEPLPTVSIAEPPVIPPSSSTEPIVVPASTTPPTPVTSAPSAPTTTEPVAAQTPAVTIPLPPSPGGEPADPLYAATNAAFDRLAGANRAASLTVVRAGQIVVSRASGLTIDGQPATSDSPMVVASVSKIIVAVGIARLAQLGAIDVAAPFPWADVGLNPNPGWNDVTIRELLDHTGGLEKARASWFTGGGSCRDYIPSLLTSSPNGDRGRWVYSNGNYCLLGLLVEQRMGAPLDVALQALVFDPVDASGVHLTYGGLLPGDLPHPDGVERLSRLGGAGTLIVSTDDTALALGRLTPDDLVTLQAPGVFTDQYGIGHTGTVDGAKSCIWLLELGQTVVSATIAGNSVSAGGGICDLVVPAVATDLGIGAGRPDRTP